MPSVLSIQAFKKQGVNYNSSQTSHVYFSTQNNKNIYNQGVRKHFLKT